MVDQTIGVARIGVEVDASKAEAGTNKAKQAVRSLGTEVENSSTKQVQATRRQEAALERQIATLGLSRDQVIRWRIAQQASGEQADKLTAALDRQIAKMRAAGTTSGQYNNAMRMLPAQYTDIVTQIAGGQNLGLILLQQGGQIRDSFGSIGQTIKGVGASLTMFINPITLAAGALGALGVAAYQGADELTTLNAALISSGNAAGLTGDAVADLAGSLDAMEGVTRGKAVDALAAVAATGSFTADQMRMAAEAALEWNVATGAAVDDTVRQFTKLADDPVKAMIELNNQMGYLTEEQLEVVRNLVSQGQHTEAATEAIRLHAEMLSARSKEMTQNIGSLERSWRSVKGAILEVWDAMKSVGRENTLGDQIKMLESNLEGLKAGTGLYKEVAESQRTRMAAEWAAKIADLKKQQAAALQGGQTGAGSQESRRALEANNKFQEQLNSAKGQQLDLEGKILKMRQEATKAGVTDAKAIAEMEKVLRDQDAREKAKKAANASGGDGGLGNSRLAAVRAEGQAEKAARDASTRELQATYSAREISANDYYARMRQLSEEGTKAEEANIRKQIAVLQEQTGKRVQSGVVAQQIAALESQLAKAREEGASRLKVLDTQENAAREKRENALRSYREALTASTDALRAQMDTMVARVGMGDQEYEIQSKINDVYAEQARRLRDIAAAEREGLEKQDADAQRESLRTEVDARVKAIEDGYTALSAAQADWGNGFSAAFANYANTAMDYAGQIQSALGSAFQGAEDAIIQFTRTGKMEFADLARSIMEDLTRIAIKKAIVGMVNMFTGGGGYTGTAQSLNSEGSFGYFADGGFTGAGGKYDPKGVVHAGEVVWSAEDVARAGGVQTVEAMRKGKKGYSSGGSPGMTPSSTAGGPDIQINLIGLDKAPSRTEQREENGGTTMDLIWEEADARAAEGVANGTSMLAMALRNNKK